MTQIKPIVFPLNLGTADTISISLMTNTNNEGARIGYSMFDSTQTPQKMLASKTYEITDEEFVAHGNDKEWITNYVVERLGVTLLQNG
jgi:hypothetical protein